MSTKPLGFPLSQDALKLGGQAAPQASRLVEVTLRVAGALRLSPGSVCVFMCACMDLDLGTVPLSAPCQALCHLCQVPQQRHSKPNELRAKHPHPRQGSRDQLCEAVVLVLVGLEVPQSPCPAFTALPGWMLGQAGLEAEHRQGCQQGRSTQSSLQAFASPDLSEEWLLQPSMGQVPLSCSQWLCPPLMVAPSQQPGHPSWQSPWPWMLGSISHHREMAAFGMLILELSCATSAHKRGTLVPRHCRGHSSRICAGRRGSRIWTLILCSEQCLISGFRT